MTDERPRPKYGEYAPIPKYGEYAPVPPAPTGPPPAIQPPPPPAYGRPDRDPLAPRARWDRAITYGLLAFGAFDVAVWHGQFVGLAAPIQAMFEVQGVGPFSLLALADQVGAVIAVTRIVLLVATVALSILSLRANRVSFWIPLVGGAVAWAVAFVGMSIVIAQDPAYLELSQKLLG